MQPYELAFIVDADFAEDKRESVVDAIKQLLTQNKANPGELETWGKRDFTFTIAKKNAGVYYLQYFTADSEAIVAIDRKLAINTNVLRFLITKQIKNKPKKQKTHRKEA